MSKRMDLRIQVMFHPLRFQKLILIKLKRYLI